MLSHIAVRPTKVVVMVVALVLAAGGLILGATPTAGLQAAALPAPRAPLAPLTACSNVSFAPAQNYGTDSQPFSVAVGDFNRDGTQDLAVANGSASDVSILLGTGTGAVGAATNFAAGTHPYSVAIGDFNRDGNQDLAVANNGSANVSILLGTGSGSFGAPTNYAVGGGPYK